MELDIEHLKQLGHVQMLDEIQASLERSIANYEITYVEDLLDVEEECISRFVVFNRGSEKYWVVFKPDGFLRSWVKSLPLGLMGDIHNAIIGFLNSPIDDENLD